MTHKYNAAITFEKQFRKPFKPPETFDEVDESSISNLQMERMRFQAVERGLIKKAVDNFGTKMHNPKYSFRYMNGINVKGLTPKVMSEYDRGESKTIKLK